MHFKHFDKLNLGAEAAVDCSESHEHTSDGIKHRGTGRPPISPPLHNTRSTVVYK